MLYLLPPRRILPVFGASRQAPDPGARISCGSVWTLPTPVGNAVVQQATGSWAYLSDAELQVLRDLDGRRASEVTPPGGFTADDVAELAAHLVGRGILAADGRFAFDQQELARDVRASQIAFFLVLQLSGGCNLACAYCYWGHVKPAPALQMERVVATTAIDRAFSTDVQHVVIDFGEVAVAEKMFRDLVDYAKNAARRARKEVELTLQTNGTTLDRDLVEYLRDQDLIVNVSMDGPQDLNDKARVYHGGQGAYRKTAAGIRLLVEAGVPLQVKVTVGRHNVDHPERVVRHLAELGVDDYLLKPVIQRGAADNQWGDVGITQEQYIDFLRRAYAADGRLDQMMRNFLCRAMGSERGWDFGCTSHSCVAGHRMAVVEPDGRLTACQRFTGVPTGGETVLGHTPETPLHVRVAASVRESPTECQQCAFQRLCGEGCPLIGQSSLVEGTPLLDPDCSSYIARFRMLFGEVLPRSIASGTPPQGFRTVTSVTWSPASQRAA